MRLLDLFCGAGGASMGYSRAGFSVVGVDIRPQPRYPFPFHLADALDFAREHGAAFDALAASPPCQRYSNQTRQHARNHLHPDLVDPTREVLLALGKPYALENVVGAPVQGQVLLCGSMFGSTRLRRHRWFESNVLLLQPSCRHEIQRDCISVAGHTGGTSTRAGAERFGTIDLWREVMGIDWMLGRELAESIPPFYTEFIGRQLLAHIRGS
jgi:DNA (cytosine-5)-methyltransferase 1